MQKTGKDFWLAHGFKEVTAEEIKGILKPGKITKLTIEASKPEPYMLLVRAREKSAIADYDKTVETWPEYLIIKKNDRLKTSLFSVPLSSLRDILFKKYGSRITEIIFKLAGDDNSYMISFHN